MKRQSTAIDLASRVDIEAARAIFRPDHAGALHIGDTLNDATQQALRTDVEAVRRNPEEGYASDARVFHGKVPIMYPTLRRLVYNYLRDVYNPLGKTLIEGKEAYPSMKSPDEVLIRTYNLGNRSTGFHPDSSYINLIGIFTVYGDGLFHVRSKPKIEPFKLAPGSLVLIRAANEEYGFKDVWHNFALWESKTRAALVIRVRDLTTN